MIQAREVALHGEGEWGEADVGEDRDSLLIVGLEVFEMLVMEDVSDILDDLDFFENFFFGVGNSRGLEIGGVGCKAQD